MLVVEATEQTDVEPSGAIGQVQVLVKAECASCVLFRGCAGSVEESVVVVVGTFFVFWPAHGCFFQNHVHGVGCGRCGSGLRGNVAHGVVISECQEVVDVEQFLGAEC